MTTTREHGHFNRNYTERDARRQAVSMWSPAAAEWREGVLLDLWVLPGAVAGFREASLDHPACTIRVRIRPSARQKHYQG